MPPNDRRPALCPCPAPRRPLAALAGLLAATLLVGACSTLRTAPPARPAAARPAAPLPDNGLPGGAARVLVQRFPGLRAIAHASGRLQVDDADDLAVVLAPPGQAHDVVIALLVTGAGGDYRLAMASRPVAPGCDTCTTGVDIVRHVLSVHVAHPGDPDFERITYQFAYRDSGDAPRLVGVTAAQPAGDDPIAHSYAISTDLLTGSKLDTLDATLSDPARRRELRSRVPLRPPIAFDAFAFLPSALGPELRRQPVPAFASPAALPAAAAALLRARFPGLTVQSRSVGALWADGARAVAVVLAPAAAGDDDAVLALLQAQPDGRLALAATTGPVRRHCRGCEVQVRIAHHALVVQTRAVDGAGSHLVGYQFMAAPEPAGAALRLVGVRTVAASRSASGDSHRYVNTANLLTGDKLDVIEEVVRGHRTRVEHASRVPLRPAIAFDAFAFDASTLDAETRQDLRPDTALR